MTICARYDAVDDFVGKECDLDGLNSIQNARVPQGEWLIDMARPLLDDEYVMVVQHALCHLSKVPVQGLENRHIRWWVVGVTNALPSPVQGSSVLVEKDLPRL